MARPIETTPTITGKAAEDLLREIDRDIAISFEKKKELDRCHGDILECCGLNRKS